VDPLFQGLTHPQQTEFLGAFAHFIQQGGAGKGDPVGAGSVQDALCAVGKTFELAHLPNPTYATTTTGTLPRYTYHLAQQLKGYRLEDPATTPQLAVPVALPHLALQTAYTGKAQQEAPKRQAAADLINLAFYFLLRVGEYTSNTHTHPNTTQRQTQTFQVQHCTFWTADRQVIPTTSSLEHLQAATSATLTITNQKNGLKGQHIHHFALPQQYCPVKTLARRVHHVLANGGTPQDLLCTYFPTQATKRYITSSFINKTIKQTAQALGLFRPNAGYTPSDVSSHSLRAGGAMAMYLNGVPETTIMKQGRWRSSTFMHYIHEQLSGHSQGLALKMSNYIPFHNMAGPSIMMHA
jgi:hypothetical protein